MGGGALEPVPTDEPSIEATDDSGGGGGTEPTQEPPADTPTKPPIGGGGGGVDTEFPMPDDAHTITDVGGNLNFQTSMPLKDVPDFYRNAFPDYTERTLLTAITDVAISMVFDGHPSGNAIVVQAVDLGNGNTNINIRLEAIP
jgi:hypothetical protein